MKKAKILAAVAAAAVLSVGGGLLAGCNSEHTHTYSDDWKNDANGHWHVATCDDLKEGDKDYKSGYGEHVWGDDNECDTCGYVKVTPPPVVTEVTIKLDANGGSLEGDAETKDVETKNGKIESLPTPTAPAGMEFVGWYTEDVGGTEVTTETPFTAAGTIYAHYVTVYTITLNVGDGTLEATTVKAKGGKVTELPTPEAPDGKQFAGWYTTAEDTEEVQGVLVTIETEFEEDITIYARYASVYTITLNVGESGSLPEGVTGTLTTKGGKLETLPTPVTQNALVFLGWYTTAEDTAEEVGELVTVDTLFTGDVSAITLYARYRQEVTVSLNVGTGTLPEGTELTYVTTESKIAELPTPAAPTNSWFKGWYTAAEGGVKVSATTNLANYADESHSATLYAIYVEEVTVTLSVGDKGTLPEGAQTTYTTVNGKIQLAEGEKGLPVPTISQAHWLFYGWANGYLTVDVETSVFEADTTITAKIGQESGIWSADGETFIKGLTVNQGCTDHLQYWLGDGNNIVIEEGTEIAIYLDGTHIPHKIKNNSTCVNFTNAGKIENTVTVTETAKFVMYLNKWPDGWQCEYTGTPSNKVTNVIPEGATPITINAPNGKVIVYFKHVTGAVATLDDLVNFQIHAWTGSSTDEFNGWNNNPHLYTKTGTGETAEYTPNTLTKKGNLTTSTTFIIHWTGAISGKTQSGNFGNLEVNENPEITNVYVIELKLDGQGNSIVYEYVAPEEAE